jgi:DNA-directed RNA polymerase subunit F
MEVLQKVQYSYILVIGYNKLQLEFIKRSDKIKEYSKAREILDKFVFHFMKYMDIRNRKNADVEKILNLCPEYVKEIPEIYVSNKATKEEIEDCFKDTLDYDLVFAKKIVNKMKIKKEYFTASYLDKNYPNLVVDVIEQSPNFSGFSFNW